VSRKTLRDVRITSIYEGTTASRPMILLNRKVVRDRGQTHIGAAVGSVRELNDIRGSEPALRSVRQREHRGTYGAARCHGLAAV